MTDLTSSSGSWGQDLCADFPLKSGIEWCSVAMECTELIVDLGVGHGGQCAEIFGRVTMMISVTKGQLSF